MKQFIIVTTFALMLLGSCKDSGANNTKDNNNDTTTISQRCKYVLPVCDGEKLEKSVRCLGKTTKNERCKNKTTNPCGFCTTHKEQFPSDGICPNQTKNVSGYCDDHSNENQQSN